MQHVPERVAVVGAGLMGHGIALELAVAGATVALTDSSAAALEQATANIAQGAATLAELGLASADATAAAPARVTTHADLAPAVAGAEMVIEAVSEDLEVKRAVFAQLDAVTGAEVILASNTSTFMPSALAAATSQPQRVLVAHYFNPPHLLPVVELVPHAGTDAAALTRMQQMYQAMGKRPVVLRREVPGFVANRLQQALLREAAALVEAGICSAEDVDAVVSGSFGRRLAVAGPFEVSDLAGLDVIAAIADQLWPDLAANGAVAEVLAAPAAAGNYGAKTGSGFYRWDAERSAAVRGRMATALAAIAGLGR